VARNKRRVYALNQQAQRGLDIAAYVLKPTHEGPAEYQATAL